MHRIRRTSRWLLASGALITLASACVVPPPPPSGPPRPLKVSYFGDSVAWSYVDGTAVTNATLDGSMVQLVGSPRIGCAVGRYTRYQPSWLNPTGDTHPLCDWSQDKTLDGETELSFFHVVQNAPPDFAVLDFCGWDVVPRRIPLGDGTWDTVYRAMGDPIYEDYLHDEFRLMVDHLLLGGARTVVVLTCATFLDPEGGWVPMPIAPELAKWMDFLRGLPAHDARVHLIDAAVWLNAQPDQATYRPDGQHFSPEGARLFADRYLDAALLALSDQLW